MNNKIKILLLILITSITLVPYGIVFSTGTSMSPTIEQGDVFFVGPTTDISEGDVIRFNSPRLDEPVVHRVVDTTEEGYITQGDNNEEIDQEIGFRPVTESQVSGQVIAYNGELLTVSGFGAAAGYIANHTTVISFGIIAILIITLFIDSNPSDRELSQTTVSEYILPIFVIGFIGIVTVGIIGTASVSVSYLHQQNAPTDSVGFVETGTSDSETVELQTNKPIYSDIFVVSDDADVATVEDWEETEGGVEVDLDVKSQEVSGAYSANVYAYNYPSLLPEDVVASIYGMNSTLGISVSVLAMMTPAVLIYLLFIDPNEIVKRDINHD